MKRFVHRFGWPIILATALVAVVFLTYANVFDFAFVYDDEFLIQKNRFLRSWTEFSLIFQNSSTGGAGFADPFYRPLQIVAYLFTQQLFGSEPFGFHLLNVSLHALNAVLVFALATRLKLSRVTAFLVALVWAVHPLHTEAITYMSGTADPLATGFLLAGLWAFLSDWKTPVRFGGTMLCFAFALLSKEGAVVFPALLTVMIFLLSETRWKLRAYLATLLFWVMALGYLTLRQTVLNFAGDFAMFKVENIYTQNILYRIMTFLATLPHYAELLLRPHDLHIDRAFAVYVEWSNAAVLGGAAMVLIGVACVTRVLMKHETGARASRCLWPAWAALWFAAAYAPCSGILVPANSLFLEHWMYLPAIGLFIAVGASLEKGIGLLTSGAHRATDESARVSRGTAGLWIRRLIGPAITFASLLVAAAFAFASYQQNPVWRDPITLFSTILKYNPDVDRVRHNLAMAYSDRGDDESALEQYRIVISHTSGYPQTFHNVGEIYLRRKQTAQAKSYYEKAVAIDPRFFPSYRALAIIYREQGDEPKAREYEEKALAAQR